MNSAAVATATAGSATATTTAAAAGIAAGNAGDSSDGDEARVWWERVHAGVEKMESVDSMGDSPAAS